MKYLILGLLFIGCTSTNPKCEIHNKAVEVLAPAIVSGLQCTDVEAVKGWVSEQVTKVGLTCDVQTKGVICEKIVEVLVGNVNPGNVLPEKLKSCTAEKLKETVAAVAKTACAQIPF